MRWEKLGGSLRGHLPGLKDAVSELGNSEGPHWLWLSQNPLGDSVNTASTALI